MDIDSPESNSAENAPLWPGTIKRGVDEEVLAKCARHRFDPGQFRDKTLAQYRKLVKDLDADLFTDYVKLKPEFLERFTAFDIFVLLQEFATTTDELGRGSKDWATWKARYPSYTEVEWAMFWHFCVHPMARTSLRGLRRDQLDFRPRFQVNTLNSFNAREVLEMWNWGKSAQEFIESHQNHPHAEWTELYQLWLNPLHQSFQTGRPGRGFPPPVLNPELTEMAQKYGKSVSIGNELHSVFANCCF